MVTLPADSNDMPSRVTDWRELRIDAVVVDPEHVERVLVYAHRPAHPGPASLLMLEVDQPATPAFRLLMHWRDTKAVVLPRAFPDGALLLRNRRSNDVVSARVVAECE